MPGTRAHTFVKRLNERIPDIARLYQGISAGLGHEPRKPQRIQWVHEKMPGLVKIPYQNEKPTVRAWTASHSCGDWILCASSRTAICGLRDKQTTLSDTDLEATWLALLGLFLTFP